MTTEKYLYLLWKQVNQKGLDTKIWFERKKSLYQAIKVNHNNKTIFSSKIDERYEDSFCFRGNIYYA